MKTMYYGLFFISCAHQGSVEFYALVVDIQANRVPFSKIFARMRDIYPIYIDCK